MERLVKAINYAAQHHNGDFRKGTDIPYITHPMGAMSVLMMNGIRDEDVLVAAIFHDLVEDTDVDLKMIEDKFGKEVAQMVNNASEPDKSWTWEKRKEHTINNLEKLSYKSKLVSLGDKFHNLLSIKLDQDVIGDEVFDRFDADKEMVAWYYKKIEEKLGKDQEISRLELYQQYKKLVMVVFA